MDKDKHARFHKIAAARTNRIIKDLRLLANCANKNNYAYTQEEAAQMLRAIDEAVRDTKTAFSPKDSRVKPFKFGGDD